MQMNNIFHTDYLRKASDDSLSEQIQKSDSSTEVNDQSQYKVNRVLTSQICNNILQYQVTWEDYDSDSEWYNTESFINSSQKLKNFHDIYSDEVRSLKRLQTWLNVYRDSKELDFVEKNNLTVKKAAKKRQKRRA